MEIKMTPIKTDLWDSVSLTSIKSDKFKTGMISFSLAMPLSAEHTALNLLLSGVMLRGSEKYPSMAHLNRRLDELYATSIDIKNARFGKNEMFLITAEILDNAFVGDETDVLDGTAEVVADLLLHPLTDGEAFPKSSVEREKVTVCDAIRAEINNPKSYASNRCAELMHAADGDFAHVKGLLQIVEDTDEISLYAHYKNLIENAKLNVFYIGSEEHGYVADIIKKHFSSFAGKQTALIPIKAEELTSLKEVTEPFAVSQGKLSMGFRIGVCTGSEEYFAAVLFNEIFGSSPASKLFMNVRERLGLCYYCASSYDTYLGNITVASGIDVANFDITKSEILRQLDEIKNGNISDAELEAAKKSIAHWYRQMYDYPFELFAFYSTRQLFGIDASPEEYLGIFEAVTREQVVSVANKMSLNVVYFLKGTLAAEDDDPLGGDE